MPQHKQVWVGLEPAFEAAYLSHFYKVDPIVEAGRTTPEGRALLLEDLLPPRHFERTEYFNDLQRPFGLGPWQGACLVHTEKRLVGVGMLRPLDGAPFDESDRRIMQSLVPHLRHAANLSATVGPALAAAQASLERVPAPFLLVGSAGRIVAMNSRAERLLARGDPLRAEADGAIRAHDARDDAALRRLLTSTEVGAAARAGTLAIHGSGGRPLVIVTNPVGRVSPWGNGGGDPVVAAFLVEPERRVQLSESTLHALFRLSPAEARVAIEVASGLTPKEAAARLALSKETVRTHLRAVFTKTGTDGQASLARLLTRLGLLRDC